MSSFKPVFLKPDESSLWEEDKSDLDALQATSFVYNPNLSLTLEQHRQRLPIYKNRDHILYLLENYQTLVLVGETGCGKSTQVPQYLYEAGWCADNKVIAVTEPRRVAVTTLAARVADEKGSPLGHLVGYSIRFDDKYNPDHTRIKYLTEGILLREMMADPLLRNYSVIVLDEVHERTLFTDIVMGLLKKILRKRRSLRLVVASATVDAEHLRNFFDNKDSAVILSVQGRLYPVDVFYANEPVADYVKATVDTVLRIHETEDRGDILAFLTGYEEVDQAVSLLKEHSAKKLLVLPMYGSVPNADQLKVFRPTPSGLRKVVVATNIAETSVTVSGIVYVVDCGFVKMKWFDPKVHADSLVVVPVSQASANQRAGRAGRVRSGKVFRLYTEEAFEKLAAATPPEMQRTELGSAVLQLKALGIDNILRFNFPSPPPAKNLLSAIELLYALEALDAKGNLTDPLGLQMAEFPLSPLHSKVLLSSKRFSCVDEVTAIMALLQVRDVFVRPGGGQAALRARIAHRKFEVAEGDLLTLLNVYAAFHKRPENHRKAWCGSNFLCYKALVRADQIRQQMINLLKRFDITSCSTRDESAVRKCLTMGLFPNAAYLHHSGTYRTVRGATNLQIHPTSVLYNVEQPRWVLFNEIVHTQFTYMREITVVEPEWLEELAPHFYERGYERNDY